VSQLAGVYIDKRSGFLFETVDGRDAVVSLQGRIHGASQTRNRFAYVQFVTNHQEEINVKCQVLLESWSN